MRDQEPQWYQEKCPKCGQLVDRIDGEYERHYLIASVLCSGARREITGDRHLLSKE